jgi:hypothetical protein
MRIYLSLPALAFAALLGFSASGVQAGRFFGSGGSNTDYTYQYPNGSQNSFDFGPGSYTQARPQPFRHRLFHRNQGVANYGMPANAMPGYGMPANAMPGYGMPANAMPGYGMPPVNGVPIQYMQAPMVQSPMQSPPVHMTSSSPVAAPVVPAMQSPPCKCGQSRQPLAAPAMQSRIVPVPASMPAGPTTAEPPPADPSSKAPF